ncbi:MAG: 2-hydroxy-3-oxopropionate reductase [Bacillati bacterium ANGP1]|uniref:2-hydroxy-3-oxopropionate reductase n=1 Tax=Candidatus Segetimicrobium genomatis TaxID=2569760 RepID=A0A537INA4_9BACT|nr:MAG: 2-hydroxy-3-oxopropionate reductase [Terrabacteria group bacterium ANGP1]
MAKERVGFIGLGIMGKPMARNLLKSGHPLIVHSRSRAPVDELVGAGAADGKSPRGVAQQSDIVITMLPDSPDVQQVVLGRDGVLEGIRPGSVLVDMSTISPLVTQEIANAVTAKGAQMLDAPVSGGEKGAIEATLSIMAGGPEPVFTRVRPVFETLGKNVVHIGGAGAGQVTKACNQIVVALTIQAVSEALVLAAKAGVDPAKVRQALLGGFAQSRILDVHGQRMLERNFKPGFRVRLHQKDLNIALSTGKALGVPLPATAVVQEAFTALRGLERSDWDHSALVTLIEELARVEVRPGS